MSLVRALIRSVLTKNLASVSYKRRPFGRFYSSYVICITDISISDRKFSKVIESYVFYLFKKKSQNLKYRSA